MSSRHRFWSKVAALVLGVGCSVTHVRDARGQEASAVAVEQQLPRTYINKTRFHLPLLMDDSVKGRLREIHLYSRDAATGSWKLLDKGTPQQSGFAVQNDKEGEYCFSMMMVDRNGRTIPADVGQLTPSLIVVVDLKSPQVDVSSLGTTEEGHTVQADVRDSNLDPAKVVFQYQTKDQVWRSLEPMKGTANRYSIPTQAATTGMVRVTAVDLANNTTRRDFDLANLAATTPAPVNSAAATAAAGSADGVYPKITLPNAAATAKVQPGVAEKVERVVVLPNDPGPKLAPTAPAFPGSTLPGIETSPAPAASGTPALVTPGNSTTLVEERTPAGAGRTQVVTANSSRPDATISRRLLNQTRLVMDYQLEQVGASGVGKVEVWITRDNGQTWTKLCDDPDCKSPVNVELPGEGVFGLNLVVGNGRGFGGQPPQAGDAPESLVEVDLSKPNAELTSVRVGTGDDAGGVVIQWKSDDRNLGAEAVDLFFATSRDGNWMPIAKNLKAEGRHRWVPPTNVSQVFVRMVARDLTGNLAVVDGQQPVQLDDQSRPRGRMLGLTPAAVNTPATPQGN